MGKISYNRHVYKPEKIHALRVKVKKQQELEICL